MDAALRWLAADTPSSFDTVRLLDGTRIICGMSRGRTKRSAMFGWCGYGYNASHSLYYRGAKLMLLTVPDGLVTGYILINPKMFGETAATSMMLMLPANVPPPASTIVADTGLRSRALETELAGRGLVLIHLAYTDEPDPGVLFLAAPTHRVTPWRSTSPGALRDSVAGCDDFILFFESFRVEEDL